MYDYHKHYLKLQLKLLLHLPGLYLILFRQTARRMKIDYTAFRDNLQLKTYYLKTVLRKRLWLKLTVRPFMMTQYWCLLLLVLSDVKLRLLFFWWLLLVFENNCSPRKTFITQRSPHISLLMKTATYKSRTLYICNVSF